MNKFKKYPEYKPVQYDYVNELPADWKVLPNIAIFNKELRKIMLI